MARGAKSLKYKWQGYIRSQWNRLDVIIVLTTALTIVLRLTLTGDAFLYARVAYCALLSMFYVRFFEVRTEMIGLKEQKLDLGKRGYSHPDKTQLETGSRTDKLIS